MRLWPAPLLVIALAAGCGASDAAATAAPDSGLTAQCPEAPANAHRVTVSTADGARLGAAVIGAPSAALGVVISQGASSTICDWLPTAADLAARRSRGLIVDRRGTGSSPGPANLGREPGDVSTAGTWLLRTGARKLLLVGSSMGTVSAFVAASPTGPADAVTPANPAAPTLASPPCGVALISPLAAVGNGSGGVNSLAVRTWPSRLWVAYEQGRSGIAADADRVAERVRGAGGTVVRMAGIPTKHPSLQLLRRHAEARALLADAATAC